MMVIVVLKIVREARDFDVREAGVAQWLVDALSLAEMHLVWYPQKYRIELGWLPYRRM